ncbi:MAG: cytochrome b/b6 domain-containing protein [Burkholderiaceae bacterium]
MTAQRVRIWDLPTRLFHWSLAVLVVFSIVTAHIGGAWIDWHFRSGYAVLALIAFRIAWGFVGGRHARFANFLRGPSGIAAALRGEPAPHAGHNPLGGLSVIAMLALIGAQAVGGLFANDDIASEGPLVRLVSKATSDTITTLHRINEKLIIALVVLHVAAIFFYLWRKRTNLVRPMITGDKSDVDPAQSTPDDAALRVRAALLLALSAAAVWWLVKKPA